MRHVAIHIFENTGGGGTWSISGVIPHITLLVFKHRKKSDFIFFERNERNKNVQEKEKKNIFWKGTKGGNPEGGRGRNRWRGKLRIRNVGRYAEHVNKR